jgi:hypothetical protein
MISGLANANWYASWTVTGAFWTSAGIWDMGAILSSWLDEVFADLHPEREIMDRRIIGLKISNL